MDQLPDPGAFGAAFERFMAAMTDAAVHGEGPLTQRLREHLGTDPRELPSTAADFSIAEHANLQLGLDAVLGDAEIVGYVVGSFQAGKLRPAGRCVGRPRPRAAPGEQMARALRARRRRPRARGARRQGLGHKRPVKIAVDDSGAVDPGLLLVATFVVRGLAEDAGAAAGASAGAVG
jgi:hypothetical protein